METGYFYFIKDEYYEKFKNCGLMENKEDAILGKHGRPCYYCYEKDGLCWLIPISSRIEKYRKLYAEKMTRYNGKFDGIRFGYVNGRETAFLIQNLCPVTADYIASEYRISKNAVRVTIDRKLSEELNSIVRKALRLYFDRGVKIVLTDLDTILSGLNCRLICQ